jgi:hypothetical protein
MRGTRPSLVALRMPAAVPVTARMSGTRVVSSVGGPEVRGRGRRERHRCRGDGSRFRLLQLPGRRVATVTPRRVLDRAVAGRGARARCVGRRQGHGREDPAGLTPWCRRLAVHRRGDGGGTPRGRTALRRRSVHVRGDGGERAGSARGRQRRRRGGRRRRRAACRSRARSSLGRPERDEQARPNSAGGRQMPGRRCGQADSLRLRHGAEVPREHGRAPNRPRQQDRCEETVDAPHASTPHCRQHHSKEVSAGRDGHLNMVGDEGEMGG